MDSYSRSGGTTAAGAKTDQTLGVGSESGSGSGAWPSPSGSPPPSAFLYPAFDTCSSDTSDVDPSLLRFTRFPHLLRYSSPPPEKPPGARRLLQMKSAIGSGKLPPPFQLLLKSPALHKATPIKMAGMEEDVLVMDGVLVTDARPNIGRNNSAEFGSPGNSSSSGSSVSYKRDLVRFALGKEDLWCPRSWKQKNELVGTKFVPSAASGKYTSRFSRYISLPGPNTDDSGLAKKTVTNLIEIAPVATFTWPPTAEEDAPMEDKLFELAPVSPTLLPSSTFTWPPTAEENMLIEGKLYGPSCQRRLPVFCQICAQ